MNKEKVEEWYIGCPKGQNLETVIRLTSNPRHGEAKGFYLTKANTAGYREAKGFYLTKANTAGYGAIESISERATDLDIHVAMTAFSRVKNDYLQKLTREYVLEMKKSTQKKIPAYAKYIAIGLFVTISGYILTTLILNYVK